MSENVCSCGKPGDKKCSKCKIACYCSRECQVADFPKHKRVCKILAKMNLNSSPENITLLPTLCSKIPLPKLPPSSPVLPLEPLLPFFLLMATMHLQCEDADWFSPVHDMLKINNNLIALVANVGMEPKSKLYTFNPFKRFYQGGSESAEHAKTAYLMMTFNGKCCELACCFGQLVLKVASAWWAGRCKMVIWTYLTLASRS